MPALLFGAMTEPRTGPQSEVEIRHAERRDAEGIRAVYNHFVTDSTALFDLVPRTLDEQVAWIDEHSGGHPALVAVDPEAVDAAGGIVGFGSLSPFRSRPAYAGTVENSVYLLDSHQRRGIGRRLLDELVTPRRRPWLPHADRTDLGRQRGLDRAARGVRLRGRRGRA